MTKPTGVHHLAISTADIRAQIEFFTDVLAMELVAFYPMHGAENALHAFVKANDHSYLAFVTMPQIAEIPIELGKTHAGWAGSPSSPGTMQHVSLNVDSEADLLAMRDRLRTKGITVFGPLNHGFCKSIYFAGPENLMLELSTSEQAIDAEAWIDPETYAKVGMTAADIERCKHPEPVVAAAEPVPQPALDPSRPQMHLAGDQYAQFRAMSDAEMAALIDNPTPPVQVAATAAAA